MDFWPKFAYTLETIESKTKKGHLIVGRLDKNLTLSRFERDSKERFAC